MGIISLIVVMAITIKLVLVNAICKNFVAASTLNLKNVFAHCLVVILVCVAHYYYHNPPQPAAAMLLLTN
jgi:hypothetical protein